MDHALRTCARLGTLLALLLVTGSSRAQLPLEASGLRGGRYVGSAAPISDTPRTVLSLGYAFTEGVLDGTDRHQRALGELAAAYAPDPLLQLSLGLAARYDGHRSERTGRDGGGAFSSELRTRHAIALGTRLSIAAQLGLRFPAAESARRGLRAATPELGLLGTLLLPRRSELSLALGYRFERSDRGVAEAAALSRADRLGASLSRFDALLLGALLALPMGRVTASLEGSWDLAVADGAPRAGACPLRLRAAAQLQHGRYVPGLELSVSPSARPPLEHGARIEPRLHVALTVGILLGRAQRAPVPQAPATPTPAPAVVTSAALLVRVVDPSGTPVAGARVSATHGARVQASESDARGEVKLEVPSAGMGTLRIEHGGFDPYTADVPPGTHVATLTRTLPEGQIKGTVRSLRGGGPVQAQVEIMPLGVVVATSARGEFVVNVPSGHYVLAIRAEGFEPQQRPAQVEHLGVTIVLVDLRRARR